MHWLTCFGRGGNAMAQDQPDVECNKSKHAGWNNKDMNGEETAQGCAADGVTSENESREPVTNQRHASRLFRGDYDRPGCGLIPAQQLAGESHHQGEKKKEDSSRPIHFPWILICAKEKGLRHMCADHQDHGGRTVVMQSTEEMSE